MTMPAPLNDLLSLPREERARLAMVLIDSLEEESDVDAGAAWVEELQRRAEDARANPGELEDMASVRARLAPHLGSS